MFFLRYGDTIVKNHTIIVVHTHGRVGALLISSVVVKEALGVIVA